MELVIEALDDLTMQILLVCAAVSLVINFMFEDPAHAWIEPAAILAAVSACTLVAAGNDYQKEKQFIELNKVAEDKKKVSVHISSHVLTFLFRSRLLEKVKSSDSTIRNWSSVTLS